MQGCMDPMYQCVACDAHTSQPAGIGPTTRSGPDKKKLEERVLEKNFCISVLFLPWHQAISVLRDSSIVINTIVVDTHSTIITNINHTFIVITGIVIVVYVS